MSPSDYQQEAERTLAPMGAEQTFSMLAMGLAGEAGEVVDELKKALFHDHRLDRDKILDELGDVLWYVANLATMLEADIDSIMDMNVYKLRKRYPNGFDPERSRSRE